MSREPSPPMASVVVCTSGERSVLARAVRALLAQTLPGQEYEIVVVANTADRAAYEALRREIGALDNPGGAALRFVQEPRPGLSIARNTGIAAAAGPYVAFVDDDALAEPHWLENIVARFESDPNVASVGGNIVPLFEQAPPAWLTPQLHTYLSCRIFGTEETDLPVGLYFFGANMAFRKDVLEACGGFDARLGRNGKSLLSNEEWTVFHHIDHLGMRKLCSPEVSVRHVIPSSRLRPGFFIRRLWWQGVSDTVFHLGLSGRSRSWVLKKAWKDFIGYYGTLRSKLKNGVSTPHLAFFNLFRWGGILYATATAKTILPCEAGGEGACHD